MSYAAKQKLIKALCYAFLGILLLICIVPVYMILINATRETADISRTLSLLPSTYIAHNWQTLQGTGVNVVRATVNSIFVAGASTFLAVYFSLLTAYAISVYNFKFKTALYVFILAMNMVPGQLFIIGFFQYAHMLNLLDSFIPLIVPAIASSGAVFFFKQYFDAALVPELIQAARIDGAGEFSIFNRIVLPIAKPGAFTMAIFGFVASWNNFIVPFFLIGPNRFDLHTLPLAISRLNTNVFRQDFGLFYLGMAISIVPIVIVYALFSKHIVSGISLGSVKE